MYYRDDTALKFEPVIHFLTNVQRQVNLQSDGLTMKKLSILTGKLKMYYEKKFGISGQGRECTKLPPRVFEDYTVGGSLCIVLMTCYDNKHKFEWQQFSLDVQEESKDIARQNVQMCINIHKALVDKSMLRVPCIFFEKIEPGQSTSKLEDIVISHGGCIAASEREATHVILMADPKKKIIIPDKDYLRTIQVSGDKARVHWWYFPDSYDEWLPLSEIQGLPEPPEQPQGAWRVTERFLYDLEKYNEWMNEEDYEEEDEIENGEEDTKMEESSDDDTEDDQPIASSSKKRKAEPASSGSGGGINVSSKPAKISKFWLKKRKMGPSTRPPPAIIQGPCGWPTSNMKREVRGLRLVDGGGWAPVGTWSNISAGQSIENETHFPYSAPFFQKYLQNAKIPKAEYVVPRHASWFDPTTIHVHERRAMQEFFTRRSKKKLDIYMQVRNFIINTHSLNPHKRLTLDHCFDLIEGDQYVTASIHYFLEQWGLINHDIVTPNLIHTTSELDVNYPILCPSESQSLALPRTKAAESNGEAKTAKKERRTKNSNPDPARIEQETKPLARPLTLLHRDKTNLDQVEEKRARRVACIGPSLVNTECTTLESSESKLPASRKEERSAATSKRQSTAPLLAPAVCCAVTGRPCTGVRYSLRQDRSYVISPEAFLNGDFPTVLCSDDFVRETADGELQQIQQPESSSSRLLSLGGEHALLEGVDSFKDDFESVSEQVGMPSKEHALLQFLRLPLMDPYIEQHGLGFGVHPKPDHKGPTQAIPFNKSTMNPLMAQLAVVASKLSPHVAAAMAKEALLRLGKLEEEADGGAGTNGVANGGDTVKKEIAFDKVVDSERMAKVISQAYVKGGQKARELAAEEERQMHLLVTKASNIMLQKVAMKMENLRKLDQWLKTEQNAVIQYKTKVLKQLATMTQDPAVAKLLRRRSASYES